MRIVKIRIRVLMRRERNSLRLILKRWRILSFWSSLRSIRRRVIIRLGRRFSFITISSGYGSSSRGSVRPSSMPTPTCSRSVCQGQYISCRRLDSSLWSRMSSRSPGVQRRTSWAFTRNRRWRSLRSVWKTKGWTPVQVRYSNLEGKTERRE